MEIKKKQLEEHITQYITKVINSICGLTSFLGNTFIAQIRGVAT